LAEEVKRKPRTRGNGQGTAYKLPNGKWRAEYTLGWDITRDEKTGVEISRKRVYKTKSGFKTKRDALAYIGTLQNGVATDHTITFKALYELWGNEHYPRISKDAENGYKAAFAKCGTIYVRQFSLLKTTDLQKLVDEAKSLKGKELSARAKADIKSLLSNMYNYALQNDYVAKNYAQYVVLPKKAKSKKDAFTPDEIETLWNDYNNGGIFTGYILIMIYTGMRFGEISIIKKDNIHLSERYMIGGIKTDAGIDREIPINNKVFPIVEKFYNTNSKKLLEMHEKVFYNSFYAALERLGIRKLNPHCCRHTFFTLMANADVQPAIIMETGGHEEYQTTMGYTHIRLAEKLDAVNKL